MNRIRISILVLIILAGYLGGCKEKGRTISLVENGVSEYVIVVSNQAKDEYDIADTLSKKINEITGITIEIIKDRVERTGKEILVGKSNRPEYSEVIGSFIGANDYSVTVKGDTLVLAGGSIDSLKNAVDYFIQTYVGTEKRDALMIDENINNTYIGSYISIVENGKSDYRIVVGKNDSYGYELATKIKNALSKATGFNIDIYKDFSNPTGKEIIIGQTSRQESNTVINSLKRLRDHSISLINDNIVIVGGNNMSLKEAVDNFTSCFLSNEKKSDKLVIDKNLNIIYTHEYSKAENEAELINNRSTVEPEQMVFEKSIIYKPTDSWYYNNFSNFVEFKGKYYALWNTARLHEDSCGQHVVYSVSDDLKNWSEPKTLIGVTKGQYNEKVMWGALYVYNDKLYCGAQIFEYYPNDVDKDGRGDFKKTMTNEYVVMCSDNGIDWYKSSQPSGRVNLLYNARNSQNLKEVADRGADYFAEGSLYTAPNGNIYALFRSVMYNGDGNDGNNNFKWACISYDGGITWSKAYPTQFTDAPQKAASGTLPDGRVYYVGSPASELNRNCLMLYISEDGINFDKQYILYKGNDYKVVMKGVAKDPGYNYPETMIVGDTLHVAYAINKESIEIIHIPLASISK